MHGKAFQPLADELKARAALLKTLGFARFATLQLASAVATGGHALLTTYD